VPTSKGGGEGTEWENGKDGKGREEGKGRRGREGEGRTAVPNWESAMVATLYYYVIAAVAS